MNKFTQQEADDWYTRNKHKFFKRDDDPIIKAIFDIKKEPKTAIEFGCADGYRLQWIRDLFGTDVYGVDISRLAIESGYKNHSDVKFKHASIVNFYDDQRFDLIIFGFCLYLLSPDDLPFVVGSANSLLNDGGHIIIWDYREYGHLFRKYLHAQDVVEHHMDFSRCFTWLPWYSVVNETDAPEGPVITLKKQVDYEISEQGDWDG